MHTQNCRALKNVTREANGERGKGPNKATTDADTKLQMQRQIQIQDTRYKEDVLINTPGLAAH